jgi:hypothetical protein
MDEYAPMLDSFEKTLLEYAYELIHTQYLTEEGLKTLRKETEDYADDNIGTFGVECRQVLRLYKFAKRIRQLLELKQKTDLESDDWYTKVKVAVDSSGQLHIVNPMLTRVKRIYNRCQDLVEDKVRDDQEKAYRERRRSIDLHRARTP